MEAVFKSCTEVKVLIRQCKNSLNVKKKREVAPRVFYFYLSFHTFFCMERDEKNPL